MRTWTVARTMEACQIKRADFQPVQTDGIAQCELVDFTTRPSAPFGSTSPVRPSPDAAGTASFPEIIDWHVSELKQARWCRGQRPMSDVAGSTCETSRSEESGLTSTRLRLRHVWNEDLHGQLQGATYGSKLAPFQKGDPPQLVHTTCTPLVPSS